VNGCPIPPEKSATGRLQVYHVLALAAVAAAVFWLKFGYWFAFPGIEHIDVYAHMPRTYRWHDRALFPNDLMTDYFETYHLTPGVRAVYYLLIATAGLTIPLATRIVATACFVAAFALLVAAVRQGLRGGPWWPVVAGVAVAMLPLAWPRSTGIDFCYWLDGGLSRAPSAAVLLLLLFGLARPSMIAVNLALVLGALTYPPAFVLTFAAAGIAALASGKPREILRSIRRMVPGAAVAALVVLLWYPLAVDPQFGPLLTRADIEWAPEIVTHHFPNGTQLVPATLQPWLLFNVPVLVVLYVNARLTGYDRLSRAGTCVVAAGFVTTIAGFVLWPRLYDYDRYVTWPQRVLFVTLLAAILARLFGNFESLRRGRAAAVVAFCVVALVAVGTYRLKLFPVEPRMPPSVAQFIADLPIDARIAAYPGDGDDVPLGSRRALLVHPVALYPYHAMFHREARRRFLDTRDAVYATDWAAVRRLRDDGVGYLLLNRARFRPDKFDRFAGHVCLSHMAMYTADVIKRGPDQPFVLRSPPAAAIVAKDGDFLVIDLNRIP
jgi:hypothetical protein